MYAVLLLLACMPSVEQLPHTATAETTQDGLEVIPFCQLSVLLGDAEADQPVSDAALAIYADGDLQDEAYSEADGVGELFLGEHLLDAELTIEVEHTDYHGLVLEDEALFDWRGDHSMPLELWLEPLQ